MNESHSHNLLIYGMLLFILGLINGAAIPYFKNSRMGLSSHLAGVQNAMVLLIFGLLWHKVFLNEVLLRVCYWLSLFSMYSIWLALVLSAIWGTSRSTPIAGTGYQATKDKELIVRLLLASGSIAIMITACALLYGLL